jgi:ribosomal protein L19
MALLQLKDALPKISLGDKIKVVVYLELPESGTEKKGVKGRIQAFEGVVISRHLDSKKK